MAYGIPYVSVANGRVVYRPRLTGDLKNVKHPTDKNGFIKPIRLGNKGDAQDDIMQAYLAAKQSLINDKNLDSRSLKHIVKQYQQSSDYKKISIKSQYDRNLALISLLSYSLDIDDEACTLGDVTIEELTRPMLNAIREARLLEYQAKDLKGAAAINRQVSYLQTAIKWGLNYMPELPAMANPIEGIKKFKEEANKRYVTHEEMEIQCTEAAKYSDYLPIVIRLSYLLGTRGVETINTRWSHLLEEGVDVNRRKGSQSNIIKWSAALKAEVAKAKQLPRPEGVSPIDPYLLTNTRGDPISQSTLQSAMWRLRLKMTEAGLGDSFFTLHKTKSKAQSDSQDDNISGLSGSMKKRYTTKKKVIDTGLE